MRGTLIVFARQPVAGRVKTRLATSIGAAAACEVYVALAAIALDAAAGLSGVAVELCIDGDPHDPVVRAWAERARADVVSQGDGDLGARMHRALARAVQRGAPAVLIGTDCPGYEPALLERALETLRAPQPHGRAPVDAVFAPAEDGGYALVGVRSPQPVLFAQMPWGTGDVMEETRARCTVAGLRWHELPTVWDVDDAAGLARWRG